MWGGEIVLNYPDELNVIIWILKSEKRRGKKKHSPTTAETKTALQKIDHNEKEKLMSQMKGQGKIPAKQLNEVEIGNLLEK